MSTEKTRLDSTRLDLEIHEGRKYSCTRSLMPAEHAFYRSRRPSTKLRECNKDSSRSLRLSPESANETDCYNHRQKRQAVVNIRSVVSEPCKVKETKSSSGTTNKSEEIGKIEVHIVTCQITTDKTTRAQVQTKIWDSVHALTPFQPIG